MTMLEQLWKKATENMSITMGVVVALALTIAAVAVIALGEPNPGKYGENATVKIEVDGGYGSGVHIGNGLFLTAGHVVDAGETITVKGKSAEIVVDDDRLDVAVIRVKGLEGMPSVELADADGIRGEVVYATGNPDPFENITTFGQIVGEVLVNSPLFGSWPYIQFFTATGGPGISGGPVFDPLGEVIGIYVTGPVPFGGIGGMVPVSAIHQAIDAAING